MANVVRPVAGMSLCRKGNVLVSTLKSGEWIDIEPGTGKWRQVVYARPQKSGAVPWEICLEPLGEGYQFLVFLLPTDLVPVAVRI